MYDEERADLYSKYGGIDAQLLTIDLMEGHDFEYWTAGLLRKIGFTQVEVTPGSGDQGVDILAKKEGVKYAIQCKRYSSDLGNKPVQEVHAGKSMYNCHVGAVITNQHFTAGAKELAKATGVLLWDREWIKNHLEITDETIPIQGTSSTVYDDEMLPSAVDIILETGQASVSVIQRRLKLGYAHAARIVDEMEEKGIVGPFQGSKPRAILITKEEWDRRNGRTSVIQREPDIDYISDIKTKNMSFNSSSSKDDKISIALPADVIINAFNERYQYKKKWATFSLCFFFGWLGAHRFYVGKKITGFIWLFTFGMFGFGWIGDSFLILFNKFLDKNKRILI